MTYFSRVFQHFASPGNTRYEWRRPMNPLLGKLLNRQSQARRHDHFVLRFVFVT
jgi:hypothetical protein